MIYYNAASNGFFDDTISQVPENSVAVSADLHRSLLIAQGQGKVIGPDDDGNPIALDPQESDLAFLKGLLSRRVDADAEAIRGQYITSGAGQAMAYLEKARQAAAFLAAADPEDADYPLLVAEVGITGETVAEVAGVIDARQRQWVTICAEIEPIRISAKEQIRAAETAEAAQAIFDAIDWPLPA